MSSIVYKGSPLDDYLKESDIVEETELARVEEVGEVEASAPGGWGSPAEFKLALDPKLWEEICWRILALLPPDLINLLGLSPITPRRTSLTDRYKYIICSSSLLDSTLPRATELETEPADAPPASSSLDTAPSSMESEPPNPHKLVLFGCLPLISLLLPIPSLWRSLLFLPLALLALALSLLVKVAPSSSRVGKEEEDTAGGKGSNSQREAVESLKELVLEAEGFDRTVNAALARISSTEPSSSSSTAQTDLLLSLPLSPLRQTLLSQLISLTNLSNTTTQALLPLASILELSILSSMYGLATSNNSQPPPSPTTSVTSSGLRPFASSPHAKRMSAPIRPNLTRFVSPPRSREPSGTSTISSGGDGESGESLPPVKFTALPPRTPRTSKRQTWTPSSTRGTPQGLRSPPSPNFSSLTPNGGGSTQPPALLPSLLAESSFSPPCSPPSSSLRRAPSLNFEPSNSMSQSRKRLSHQGLLYVPQSATDSPSRKPRGSPSSLAIGPPSPSSQYSPSRTRTRRTTLPSQPRPLVESESEWESESGMEDGTTRAGKDATTRENLHPASSPLARTTSHPLPLSTRRSRPTSLIHRPSYNSSISSPFLDSPSRSPYLLSEEDEEEDVSSEPSPLSHPHLLSTFLTLHTRRRHTLVSLLALRRETSSDYWEDVRGLVLSLLDGFRDARIEISREISLSKLGGGAEGDGWAPRSKSKSQQRREWVGSLEEEVVKFAAKLNEADEDDSDWEDRWEGLREDLGGMVRIWERGREEMATLKDQFLGGRREPRSAVVADRTFNSLLDPSTSDDPLLSSTAPEFEDAEDDVTLHLIEETQLPPVGREELFAGETTRPAPSRPQSTVSREERIRLARLEREEKATEVEVERATGGRAGMGDVVLELKGLMSALRRMKGPVGSSFDEEENEPSASSSPTQSNSKSYTTPPLSSAPRFPSRSSQASNTDDAQPSSLFNSSPVPSSPPASFHTSFGFGLPPPPNRSSLPALSSGSSDGDADADMEEEGNDEQREDGRNLEGLGCGGSESTLGGTMESSTVEEE